MEINQDHFCSLLLAGNTSEADKARRAGQRAALLLNAKWDLGETIDVRFLAGTPALRQRVENVAKEWTKLAQPSPG